MIGVEILEDYKFFVDIGFDQANAKKLNDLISNGKIDEALDFFNNFMGFYGVESVTNEEYWDRYYGNIRSLYVNTGDSYKATLLYDIEDKQFYIISLSDWMEKQETSDIIECP